MAQPNIPAIVAHLNAGAGMFAGLAHEVSLLQNLPAVQDGNAVVQLTNSVQQLHNTLGQVLQQIQALQQQLQRSEQNTHNRILNSQASDDAQIMWLDPVPPAVFVADLPLCKREVFVAPAAAIAQLLAMYNLPAGGTLPDKRSRLLRYLGFRV